MPSKLIELEIPRPGIYGVNTSASGDIMPKEYAVKSTNLVWSDEGYPEARRGSERSHSASLVEQARVIYDTRDENGAELTIFTTPTKIYKLVGSTVTDITGTATTPTAGNWKFVNLNDQVIGFQSGHAAVILATPSSGTFANMSFTGSEAPTTNGSVATDIVATAGRLWVLDGDQLRYSKLLDPTDFAPTSGGGAFDLNASMLNGEDNRTALQEFNGTLLVFYENHITVFGNIWNPSGSGAGYGGGSGAATDPAMEVIENIAGVGCIARDSIQSTQNDLIFLSQSGVISLSRVIQEKSMPIQRYSDNVRKDITAMVRNADLSKIWSVYLESKGIYLIGSSDYRYTIVIDVGTPLPDGSRRCTRFDKSYTYMSATPVDSTGATTDPWSALRVIDEVNYVSRMKGYLDYVAYGGSTGTSYDIVYESAWTAIVDELENYVKIPKKIGVVIKGSGSVTFTVNIAFDYGDFADSRAKTATVSLARESRYGSATYGGSTTSSTTGYYGSASGISEKVVPGFSKGRILKIRVTCPVPDTGMSLQRISIKAKVGRQS